ncbi:HD domain-containing protein [Streptomyces sp. LaBMicrA B280]|uniref:HD domain-containing protein n=1 Tax=Streptomyces sp. LaBMicrA B280 TaxID=3391001 RepID=UPI003BA77B79
MRSRQGLGADRRSAPHGLAGLAGLAGQVLLGEWLEKRQGWPARQTGQCTVVVGGHPGVPPEHGQIQALDRHPHLLRTHGPSGVLWEEVLEELLDACAREFGVAEPLAPWRSVKLPQPVQVLLSSVVIVSDWIASNPELFPYFPEDVPRSSAERFAAAWRGLDLPGPWRPEEPRRMRRGCSRRGSVFRRGRRSGRCRRRLSNWRGRWTGRGWWCSRRRWGRGRRRRP